MKRLKSVMNQYLGETQTWNGRLIFNQCDARSWVDFNAFDKVLVDVPCTIDRHSATQEDNSIFKSSRMKERIKLPELQTAILWFESFLKQSTRHCPIIEPYFKL